MSFAGLFMTLDLTHEFGASPQRRPSTPSARGSSRFLPRLIWGGCATALVLALGAMGMPAVFALVGEGLDPGAAVDLSRAAAGLSLVQKASPPAARSARLPHGVGRRVETPAVPVAAASPPSEAASLEAATSDEDDTRPFAIAHLISPPTAFTAGRMDGALHGLDRPDLAAASRFSPAPAPSEAVAEATLENEALAEAEVASRQPDVVAADEADEADAGTDATAPQDAAPQDAEQAIAELLVPKPTARPLFSRAPEESDDEEEDDEDEAAAPRIAAARPRPPAQPAPASAPRMPASTPREAPVLAYARPDAGALRMDPSAVDPPALRPKLGNGTAVYDISAATVYLPSGERLEAHSGLGRMRDNPRFVHEKNRGPTPPHTYKLTLRESLFHGVQAIRLTPVGGQGKIHNRVGLLAHTYMLGKRGDSNGCVSFKDYKRFLAAYRRGEIRQLVVVSHMDAGPKSLFAWLFKS